MSTIYSEYNIKFKKNDEYFSQQYANDEVKKILNIKNTAFNLLKIFLRGLGFKVNKDFTTKDIINQVNNTNFTNFFNLVLAFAESFFPEGTQWVYKPKNSLWIVENVKFKDQKNYSKDSIPIQIKFRNDETYYSIFTIIDQWVSKELVPIQVQGNERCLKTQVTAENINGCQSKANKYVTYVEQRLIVAIEQFKSEYKKYINKKPKYWFITVIKYYLYLPELESKTSLELQLSKSVTNWENIKNDVINSIMDIKIEKKKASKFQFIKEEVNNINYTSSLPSEIKFTNDKIVEKIHGEIKKLQNKENSKPNYNPDTGLWKFPSYVYLTPFALDNVLSVAGSIGSFLIEGAGMLGKGLVNGAGAFLKALDS